MNPFEQCRVMKGGKMYEGTKQNVRVSAAVTDPVSGPRCLERDLCNTSYFDTLNTLVSS